VCVCVCVCVCVYDITSVYNALMLPFTYSGGREGGATS